MSTAVGDPPSLTEGDDVIKDAEMEDDSSDNDSTDSEVDDEKNKKAEEEISELAKQISQNPYLYDNHPKRIKLLRDTGDLHRLREAREEMSKHFPLTEELWLEWLQDETKLVSSEEEREKVEALFERAFQDYMSVPVWLEYVQFAIGRMGEEGGLQKVRDAFEKALVAVGLHVSQGANIWEAYREFESALSAGLMPQAGAEVSKEEEEAFSAQNHKVYTLFKRQLAIPLLDIEATVKEYQEWKGEERLGPEIKTALHKAREGLEAVQDFENQLLRGEEGRLEVYQAYIQHELKAGDPARVQCLFERALTDHCLVADLWLQYTKYLDKLNVKSQIELTYQRALRNCPWSSQLWVKQLLALERRGAGFALIKETADKALRVGFAEAADYLLIWSTYCDYLRRRIDWEGDHTEQLETFQLTVECAVNFMFENYGKDGDPEGRLRQFWAFIEAKNCKKMERAREIWTELMQEGHGAEAGMWLQYYQLERMFGDSKHCRRLLQKALNSVTDWPESITQAYLNFEREEGNLEQYDTALAKCEAQMERISERRAKAAEKEAATMDQKKKERSEKKKGAQQSVELKGAAGDADRKGKRKMAETSQKSDMSTPQEPPQKKAREEVSASQFQGMSVAHNPDKDNVTVFVSNLDFSLDEDRLRGILSKCGAICEVRLVKNYKGKSKGFGYVEFTDSNSVLQALKMDRELVNGRPMFVSRCEDRSVVKSAPQFKFSTNLEQNKLFVKGLPFTITKDALDTIFKEHGKIKEIRMVTYRNGRPKGIAYVEYDNAASAAQAVLKADGLVIGDHTISVDISNPPERKTPASSRLDPFAASTRPASLGSGKMETEFRGKARTQVALVPRAIRKPAPGQASTGGKPSSSSSSSEKAPSSSTQSMSNADFRNMMLKK